MGRLEGKVVVVTGANSGVGEETSKLLAKEGASLVICARRVEALEKAKQEILSLGGKVVAVPTDISKEEDVKKLFEVAIKTYGKVDVLVNNAGVLDSDLNSMGRYTDADYDKVININQKGTMMVTREAIKHMLVNKAGSIINIASVAGQYGCGGAVYVASKGAIIGLTKHVAMRYSGEEPYIRCNAICPGAIVTPMSKSLSQETMDMNMMQQMTRHADIMHCQPCLPQDVGNIILFLASDESRALTGQIIVSDFGADL